MNKLFFLKRALKDSPPEIKLLSYLSLIRPILEYANIVWSPYTSTCISTLERVQRKAARFIYNRHRRTDSPTELLRRAGLATLSSRSKLHRLKFIYLLLHNSFRIKASDHINISQSRITRNKHPLTLEEFLCNNNTFFYSFFPLSVREWNALDASTVLQTTVQKFLELAELSIATPI